MFNFINAHVSIWFSHYYYDLVFLFVFFLLSKIKIVTLKKKFFSLYVIVVVIERKVYVLSQMCTHYGRA